MSAATASFLFEQKIKPDVLRERVPLRFTRNTRPPLPEMMLENEAKRPNQPHYKNQIKTSFVQNNHPTTSLAQGGPGQSLSFIQTQRQQCPL
jgi:hypothetical protein